MKNTHFFLVFFLIPSLYSMNDLVEVTLANNQKTVLNKTYLQRLACSSTILKNAAQDLNDDTLPDYFPYIPDAAALGRISTLLNDDGTPNKDRCLSQTKGDWCTTAPALAALEIECFNPYLLNTLENAYSTSIFCKALLHQKNQQNFSYETLPPTLKDELATRINQKNVGTLPKYFSIKTISPNEGRNVTSLAISPNGLTFVSGSNDKALKVWDLQSGLLLKTLEGHKDCVKVVTISPNGKITVSGSYDRTLKLWDLNTGSLLQTLVGHKDRIHAAAITPDSKVLISGSWDTTLKLWDLNTGSLKQTLQEIGIHKRGVTAIAFTPDGQTIVSGSADPALALWDLSTGELIQTLQGGPNDTLKNYIQGHKGWVNTVAITPDGQTVVSGSDDATIKIWDLSTGELLKTLKDHKECVRTLVISPDGQIIISGSADKTIKIWDFNTGSLLQTLEGHEDWVNTLAITSDAQTIVSGSVDKNIIKFWQSNLSPQLKKKLLKQPFEQALLIQALRIRPNTQEQFILQGKAHKYFERLPQNAQEFLSKELNVITS